LEKKKNFFKFEIIKRSDADKDEVTEAAFTNPLNIVPEDMMKDTRYFGKLSAMVEISKAVDNRFFPAQKSYSVDYGTFSFKTARYPISVNWLVGIF